MLDRCLTESRFLFLENRSSASVNAADLRFFWSTLLASCLTQRVTP